jgi:hypothetical protein
MPYGWIYLSHLTVKAHITGIIRKHVDLRCLYFKLDMANINTVNNFFVDGWVDGGMDQWMDKQKVMYLSCNICK